jgi:hypothetical protein
MDPTDHLRHYDIQEIRRPQKIFATASTVAIACFDNPGVVLVDPRSLVVRGHVLLDWQPERPGAQRSRCPANDVAIARDRIFVAQAFSDFLLVASSDGGSILDRLPLGGEGRLAVSPDGGTIYFANNVRDEFSIIDADTLAFETFPFPQGSRGVGALLAHADGRRVILGLQRGGPNTERTPEGGNSHLAVFDVHAREFIARTYLAELIGPTQSDDSIPHCFTLTPDGKSLYVGMFQSRQGILVVDLDSYQVLRGIRFPRRGGHRGVFDWVDPLAQAVYGDLLLSVNRNNFELSVTGRREEDELVTIPLGGAGNGPSTVTIVGDRALIGHHERPGLLVVDLLGLASVLRHTREPTVSIGRDPQEVTVEDIEEFNKYLGEQPPTVSEWTSVMSQLSERQVKEGICEILGDVPKPDWGGETADHFTPALHIAGKRLTGAFLLKGPGKKFGPLTLEMLGKRANQIQRLAGTEAGVLIVQHAHEISEDVRKELRVWAREGPFPRYYCFIDGKDTYRLLKAYGNL